MNIPIHRGAILAGLVVVALAAGADHVEVPGGSFQMGCSVGDGACETDEGPPGGVTVSVPPFQIDTHEVTVAEYRRCIDSGRCTRPKDHARNKYCNYDAPGRDQHPVNCVDWQEAVDYCGWRGMRLPTEPEWEKAARAGSASRYPWGQEVSCERAILDDGMTRGSAGDELDGCGEDRTWPVGSRAANALGLYDMHGNVGEWLHNWYAPDAPAALYARGNRRGPESGMRRLVRGGSWDENPSNLRSSYRNVKRPVSGRAVYGSIGFRCARD